MFATVFVKQHICEKPAKIFPKDILWNNLDMFDIDWLRPLN